MGKYVEKTMAVNEQMIYESKQHWVILLPFGIISLILVIAGLASIESMIGMVVIVPLIMLKPLINYFCTELGFSNHRLIGKLGLINTKTLDAPLNKINNISVSSGLLGKIFGYGTVHITTSSGAYAYKHVAKPEKFKLGLMAQVDKFDEERIKKQAIEMAAALKATE